MEKKIFDFPSFLTSLTRPPMGIMNKELANILGVQDAAISKIRHGRLPTIPGQLRPLKSSERFARGMVESVSSSQATLDAFAAYAEGLVREYRLSDKLASLCWQVASDAQHAQLTPQKVKRASARLVSFFSLCYNEAHYNSSVPPEEIPEPSAPPAVSEQKRSVQALCEEIEQSGFSDAELELIEASLVAAWVPEGGKRLYYNAFYRPYAARLRSELIKPYFNSCKRKETISITKDAARYTRRVEECNHLVLPDGNPFRYFIQRTLLNYEGLQKKKFLEQIFCGLFVRVNGVDALDYIGEQEGRAGKNLLDMIQLTRVPGFSKEYPLMQACLSLPLRPECPGDVFLVEFDYSSTLPFLNDLSTNFSYRLKYPCRFFAHEHVITPDTPEGWRVAMDVFAPYNLGGNDAESSPVYQRLGRSDGLPARSQSVIFPDWTLPGSGYRRCIHQFET